MTNQPLTEDELREWERLAEEATDGLWHSDGQLITVSEDPLYHDSMFPRVATTYNNNDAAFIAAARTGWPRTIAALRAALERERDDVEALRSVGPLAQARIDNEVLVELANSRLEALRAKDREIEELRRKVNSYVESVGTCDNIEADEPYCNPACLYCEMALDAAKGTKP